MNDPSQPLLDYAHESSFESALIAVGIEPKDAERACFAVWPALVARYHEAHRTYHNLSHIDAMLDDLGSVNVGLIEGKIEWIELAIWFHDVIYDPRSATNEADSARWVESKLGAYLDPSDLDEIQRLILATQHCQSRTDAADELLLVDIDLAILGATDIRVYHAYSEAIRREFCHVPLDAYQTGRIAVLQNFLDRDRIYLTKAFEGLEDLARRNVAQEIDRLAKG